MNLNWTSKYNCHRAYLKPGFELNVNWTIGSKNDPEHPEGPYEIYAFGIKCKKRARTVEEGQQIAIAFARVILNMLGEQLS